jgi:cellobiose phosphorylase
MDIFISSYENVKFQRVKLKNTTKEKKNLKISYRIDPVLGVVKDVNRNYILCKELENGIELKNPYSIEFSNCVSYVSVVGQSKEVIVRYDTSNYKAEVEISLNMEVVSYKQKLLVSK